MEDGYLVYLTREEYQVCSIQVRGDVIDFHLAVTRGYEPAIVSASGEWAPRSSPCWRVGRSPISW